MYNTKLYVVCFLCFTSLFEASLWIFFEIMSSEIQSEITKIGLPLIHLDCLITVKLIGIVIIILSFINLLIIFGQREAEIEAFSTFKILIIFTCLIYIIFYWNFHHKTFELVAYDVSKYDKNCLKLISIFESPCYLHPRKYLQRLSIWTKYFSIFGCLICTLSTILTNYLSNYLYNNKKQEKHYT